MSHTRTKGIYSDIKLAFDDDEWFHILLLLGNKHGTIQIATLIWKHAVGW